MQQLHSSFPNCQLGNLEPFGACEENESAPDKMITGRSRNSDQKLLTSTLRSDPHCENGSYVLRAALRGYLLMRHGISTSVTRA
jgi:hypothetical protein